MIKVEEKKLDPQGKQSKTSIFLIEKGWIDPMENRIADGYEPFGYKATEQEAKDFCESHGYWTSDDCWSIRYKSNGRMWKYRYKEVKYCI